MADDRPDIRGLFPEEISEILVKAGEKMFRGVQVFNWIQARAVQDWSEIKNTGAKTKDILERKTLFKPLSLLTERISKDGTRKYLWELHDGNVIESVLLYHAGEITKTRNTVCLSTQVGCPMGCTFCATGQLGFKRNLSAGEIAGQVLDITRHRRREEPDFKVSNIVYMGMGEPLLNLPAVVKSIKIINHKDGQNIGIRRITVSTCGLVPQIDELSDENLDIVLAVSLHAPSNELRNKIMPVNKKYPLEELIPACRRYLKKTGRRITFEYALVKNFNDGPLQARQLVGLLQGLKVNINVIPVNIIRENINLRPDVKQIKEFVKLVKDLGVNAVLREEKGGDIEAACGQLAGTVR